MSGRARRMALARPGRRRRVVAAALGGATSVASEHRPAAPVTSAARSERCRRAPESVANSAFEPLDPEGERAPPAGVVGPMAPPARRLSRSTRASFRTRLGRTWRMADAVLAGQVVLPVALAAVWLEVHQPRGELCSRGERAGQNPEDSEHALEDPGEISNTSRNTEGRRMRSTVPEGRRRRWIGRSRVRRACGVAQAVRTGISRRVPRDLTPPRSRRPRRRRLQRSAATTSSCSARAAAAGSGASCKARPTTRRLAPAATAAAGVSTRA